MTLHSQLRRSSRGLAVATGLLVGLGGLSLVYANDIDEIQRRDLALIQTQIEQIKVVVDRIDARQVKADPASTRLYFNIPRLRSDLDAISHGIDGYLAPDRLLPREVQPLDGDYLDDRGH
ncbi:RAQPRD family integrative conjugative element protein [Salinicola peritrichatus]|uniref:integrative conjugative element protein, RAQPRD family n=1 Tax=Salinicola peritrichatus TaxID=1267424 RepID=UPI000DA1891D|nr:RAQPRD family integrative conjugative element protein [Salinicola peritrichatus]